MPTNNISLMSDQGVDVNALQRRMALAKALQEQSMQSPNNEVVGGIVVKQSPLQGVARLAQAMMAKRMNQESDEQLRTLAAQQKANRLSAVTEMQGGDVDAIIRHGLSSDDPVLQKIAADALANKIKPKDGFTLPPGSTRYGPDGKPIVSAPGKIEKPFIRSRIQGDTEIQEEMQPDGSFKEIGRGPRFAKQVASQHDTTSKPPAGYRFTSDGNGLEAIPGGPADQKKQGAYNVDMASMQGASSAMDRLAEAAHGLKAHPGLPGITGLRGAIPNMPGSNAADAEALLTTLKSQVAFGVLQAMRDASKTGGALGAVSEKELKLLEGNLAALEKAQSYEQFVRSLDDIIKYTDESKGRIRNAFNMKHGEPSEAKQPAAIGGDEPPPGAVRRKK